MLKLATIGTSWITSSFIDAALLTGHWELTCVYSRDIGKARDLLRKHRPEGGAAVDELGAVARLKPDAVYVASPNSLHCEQSVYFLRLGINVICEKPAAVSAMEWDELEEAAETGGAYILEAFRHINSPGFDAVRKAASSVGHVRNAILSYNQYSSKYEAFLRGGAPNVFNPRFAGGAMNDLGIYPISLAAALWGAPKRVSASFYMLPDAADGAGALILDYGSFLCTVSFSKIADGISESEIFGEDGNVVINKPQDLTRITVYPRAKNAAPKTKISDYGKISSDCVDVSAEMAENKMIYEAAIFADIISGRDRARYVEHLRVSRDTHRIMDSARAAAHGVIR